MIDEMSDGYSREHMKRAFDFVNKNLKQFPIPPKKFTNIEVANFGVYLTGLDKQTIGEKFNEWLIKK